MENIKPVCCHPRFNFGEKSDDMDGSRGQVTWTGRKDDNWQRKEENKNAQGHRRKGRSQLHRNRNRKCLLDSRV